MNLKKPKTRPYKRITVKKARELLRQKELQSLIKKQTPEPSAEVIPSASKPAEIKTPDLVVSEPKFKEPEPVTVPQQTKAEFILEVTGVVDDDYAADIDLVVDKTEDGKQKNPELKILADKIEHAAKIIEERFETPENNETEFTANLPSFQIDFEKEKSLIEKLPHEKRHERIFALRKFLNELETTNEKISEKETQREQLREKLEKDIQESSPFIPVNPAVSATRNSPDLDEYQEIEKGEYQEDDLYFPENFGRDSKKRGLDIRLLLLLNFLIAGVIILVLIWLIVK